MTFNKYFFLIVLAYSSCAAQKAEMINNSDSVRISQKHFEDCIINSTYSTLLDQRSKKEKVYFEYFPGAKSDLNCDGIYFYRYVSKSMPQPLYRDANGKTYSKYFLFIIIDGKITSLLNETGKKRKKFFERNRERLEMEFGVEKVLQLKDAIINGYEIFY